MKTKKSDAHEEGHKHNAHEIGRSAKFHTSYFNPIPLIPSRQVKSFGQLITLLTETTSSFVESSLICCGGMCRIREPNHELPPFFPISV